MVSGSAPARGCTSTRPRGLSWKKCGRRLVEFSTCRARGTPDGTRGGPVPETGRYRATFQKSERKRLLL